MKELAEKFLEKFTLQGHVLGLIKHADIKVKFCCEKETAIFEIKNGKISLLNNQDQICYEIHGNNGAMKQFLEGTERLRILERKGQLIVSAPLRTTLLLEAIFFLTKAHENLAKVI
ncbi:hypothetical protein [Neobacillus cucumis]|uniref:SCP2 domain-containing protein n=1 Tax=Neobacillus cucumis TaxID=1740721 RepID=A0A2N5HAU2_9BACI|nr:hypothetical protein [Neobacillus cucumis]PLS02643.1 hypothetical protein CVD27_19095 [Neobacillus cucumis]